jgi:hypothetical protein
MLSSLFFELKKRKQTYSHVALRVQGTQHPKSYVRMSFIRESNKRGYASKFFKKYAG